jgi:hypothetical protein
MHAVLLLSVEGKFGYSLAVARIESSSGSPAQQPLFKCQLIYCDESDCAGGHTL